MGSAIVGIVVRHLLSGLGAALVAQGIADTAAVESIAGGAMALVGVVLSYLNKKRLLDK